MEMHTAQLPDGMYVYIIGSEGEWEIWESPYLFAEPIDVMDGFSMKRFEGIQSLASAELILEQTFGVKT